MHSTLVTLKTGPLYWLQHGILNSCREIYSLTVGLAVRSLITCYDVLFSTYTSQRISPVSRDFHSHKRKKPSIKELTFVLHLFDLIECLKCMTVLCIDFSHFSEAYIFFLFPETSLKYLYWQIIRLISSGNSSLIKNLILIFNFFLLLPRADQLA